MRTIEEVREWISAQCVDLASGSPEKNGQCLGCLSSILTFIDSDPPCKHPNRRFYEWGTFSKMLFLNACARFGATNTGELFKSKCKPVNAKYCPDCGQKLEDPCEVSKK